MLPSPIPRQVHNGALRASPAQGFNRHLPTLPCLPEETLTPDLQHGSRILPACKLRATRKLRVADTEAAATMGAISSKTASCILCTTHRWPWSRVTRRSATQVQRTLQRSNGRRSRASQGPQKESDGHGQTKGRSQGLGQAVGTLHTTRSHDGIML